jgi:hypothetical protein
VASGIFKEDNSWALAIGDFNEVYVFAVKHLRAAWRITSGWRRRRAGGFCGPWPMRSSGAYLPWGNMSEEWRERTQEMLVQDKGTKARFLVPVLEQMKTYVTKYIPTPGQERILRVMWAKHERRRLANLLGEEAAQVICPRLCPGD